MKNSYVSLIVSKDKYQFLLNQANRLLKMVVMNIIDLNVIISSANFSQISDI